MRVVRTDEITGQPTDVDVFATLDEARSKGFQHPNCTHSYSAFIPGATKQVEPESDPEGYEQKQQQRGMERGIREAKRAQVLALDAESKKAAGIKVRDRQAALRKHVADHDLKRQSGRESITRAV